MPLSTSWHPVSSFILHPHPASKGEHRPLTHSHNICLTLIAYRTFCDDAWTRVPE